MADAERPSGLGRDALEAAFERGRSAWPGVDLSLDDFAAFVEERGASVELHEDVYLACACLKGDTAARIALERSVLADVPRAVHRVSTEDDFVKDVAADLRLALLDGEAGKPALLTRYQGRGPLRSFVMVLAMRRATDRKRRQREIVTEASDFAALEADADRRIVGAAMRDLEQAFLDALKSKLSSLSARERTILRLHVVDGVPAEKIGRMYGVHRATATRWIVQAKQAVFDETREELQRRFAVSVDTFESIARDAAHGLDASLSTFLRTPEHE